MGPLPTDFTSDSIDGNGGTVGSFAPLSKAKIHQSLDKSFFFLLMQKPPEREIEMFWFFLEIHPEKKLMLTNQCCFSGHDRVFPHWVT